MKDFQLRNDLQRVVIRGFALPLGIAPDAGRMEPPVQGYTVAYVPGQDDEPDTYSFHVVVSHERLAPIVGRAFDFLPEEVFGIVEIGSRDAYRSTDTFIGDEPVPLETFLDTWTRYEPFLLEDSSIAAGANSEEPFIEIFIDQWKGLSLHVPLSMREEVEDMLREFDLDEVPQTWPNSDMPGGASNSQEHDEGMESQVRPVLDLSDDFAPDVDELLLDLRHEWKLSLNVDPESNIDEGGRRLGSTLWHAVVIVDGVNDKPHTNGDQGAYASIWATASSLAEMERLIGTALGGYPQWAFGEIYTIDRVAFDERPDGLADLTPFRRSTGVHLVTIEPWVPHGAGEPKKHTKSNKSKRQGRQDKDDQ